MKKKSRIYFGKDVQEAIIEYNSVEDIKEKNKIYADKIAYPFDKLVENIINTFKFSYFDVPFEDVKQEVVSFLVLNIHKYDHTLGYKAFSYFSVVAKNYLILHNNNNYKKYKLHTTTDSLHNNSSYNRPQPFDNEYFSDLTNEIVIYFNDKIPQLFKKDVDKKIAYAIVDLIDKRESIEIFNKKSIYILIREMTGVNTSKITNVINVLKKHYLKIYNEYYDTGKINR